MNHIQRNSWRKWILLFSLLIACFLILFQSQTAFAAEDSVSVKFQVKQTFTQNANSADANSVFAYSLTALNEGNPLPAGASAGTYPFTIDGTSTVDVGPITYTNVGVYQYEIKLDASAKSGGYSCDERVYTVSVYVTWSGNDLVTETIVQKGTDDKVDEIAFENAYTLIAANPALMVDPPVRKTVTGNPARDSAFTFTLTAQDQSAPMPEGSVNGVKKITVLGSGEAEFGTWQYTKAGTYYYTIAEVHAGQAGYSYDTAVYTITDAVKDVDGQLVLKRVVTNHAKKQVSACIFINKYNAAHDVSLKGKLPKTGNDTLRMSYIISMLISGMIAMGSFCYLLISRKRKKSAVRS